MAPQARRMAFDGHPSDGARSTAAARASCALLSTTAPSPPHLTMHYFTDHAGPSVTVGYGFISRWLLSVKSTLSYVNCTTGQNRPIAASSITETDRGRRVQRRPSMPLVVLSGAERRLWSRIPALRRHAARSEEHRGHVESASFLAVNEQAQRTRARTRSLPNVDTMLGRLPPQAFRGLLHMLTRPLGALFLPKSWRLPSARRC